MIRTDHLMPARVAGVSLVLPAFNEEENIDEVLERALDALSRMTVAAYEVIVVDDGSGDATAGIALEHAGRDPDHVRVVQHLSNQGYGAAIRSGWLHARYDLLAYTDADRQFDIAEIGHLLPLTEHADVVTGFRVYRYDSVARCLTSWAYNRLVRVMFGVKVRDVDCAMKIVKAHAFDQLALESTDFFIDTEIVARANRWGLTVAQKGVRHYPRVAGETTVRPSDIPRTLRTIGRMWRRIQLPTKVQLEEGRQANERLLAVSCELVPARESAGR
jgi:glycosyltransferase involved in cell wall biosynthesis